MAVKTGFTLIEILVALAILAIAISVAVVRLPDKHPMAVNDVPTQLMAFDLFARQWVERTQENALVGLSDNALNLYRATDQSLVHRLQFPDIWRVSIQPDHTTEPLIYQRHEQPNFTLVVDGDTAFAILGTTGQVKTWRLEDMPPIMEVLP